MKAIQNYTFVYFIGIGGIGMSALARYCNQKGLQVFGYDKTQTQLTQTLISEGINVQYAEEFQVGFIEALPPSNTLVVYTPAIPKSSTLFQSITSKDYDIYKRAEVLGRITKNKTTLAVAGTHGKTTTSAILTHILKAKGFKITAFCGGILQNYQTNFIGDGEEVIVVEADEFDKSFLQLHPTAAVVTSMDADHLDIYGSHEQLENTFKQFAALVPEHHLYTQHGLDIKSQSIAVNKSADFNVQNIKIKEGSYHFDFVSKDFELLSIEFGLPGKHNLFNAAAALCLAIDFKPSAAQEFADSLASFKGVQRRFNYLHKSDKLVLIDDYAHHPREIDAVYQAITEMHPTLKTVVVFQPHLFSRTQDFSTEFAKSLAQFDEIHLLDIYPAREEPIPGVTSSFLLNLIEHSNKHRIRKDQIQDRIEMAKNEVIVLLGAGDIGVVAFELSKKYL